jgi:16S rRNA (cytidine1402-2'-O)-methyltransferase
MKLTLVATPIGNLGDLSPRAAETLRNANFWIVEDTRVSGRLQTLLEAKRPMRVLNEHTPPAKVEALVEEIRSAESAALLTDAGTPGISDPGAILVERCYDSGIPVDAIPGPSAPPTALMLSGFFAQRYAFLGYLPRKPGAQRQVLEPFRDSFLTLVLFESPFRTEKLLETLASVLGPRRYAVCREMTKVHQQVYRDRLPNRPTASAMPWKGEFTIVVEGVRRQDDRIDE